MLREELLARAAEAKRGGDRNGARELLLQVLAAQPADAPALNSLGLLSLEERDFAAAADLFGRAAAADPKGLPLWLNLCEARVGMGNGRAAIAALDAALKAEPYYVPALLRKAQILESLGETRESTAIYKILLSVLPDRSKLPLPLQDALADAEKKVRAEAERLSGEMKAPLERAQARFPDADLHRARGYAENRAGTRKVYQQQPSGGHFPYLPALEFFERGHFPWFAELEAATETIRGELAAVWEGGDEGFRPYVAFDDGTPANQFAELNRSPRWSAWFFWENGVRNDANCARCPATASLLEKLPLLDVPGKAPTAMFSILEPKTRIPPHTGTSNIRTTVHLPLVLPDGCGFRVGSDTRNWRIGEAWAFDDTIEHEAWNDSEETRVILILDVWNPLLNEAERDVVRAVG